MSVVSPLVSVVLPVFNGSPYLQDAIDSILVQVHDDYELIVIDDGSTDDSALILERLNDPRIRFFRQPNQGLAATLNRGIAHARGQYIARQDQDDLSYPERLEKQVTFMESHPDCVLLGTWAQILEVDRPVDRFHRHPVDEAELRYQMLFNNPFVHSSVMLRKEAVQQVGGYTTDPDRQPPEDFELWSRLSRVGQVANIGEVLMAYREIPGSMSRVGPSPFRRRLITICAENLAAAALLAPDDPDVVAIAALTHGEAEALPGRPDFSRMQSLLLRAIDSFAPDPQALSLRQDALGRVEAMRAGWMVRDSAAYGLLHTVGPVRNVAKRIWRLLQRFRRTR
ncbi:glycosyltransferase family 2 protein [Cyanobium gracile]|uniref:Glycosyl transferase n=1 Tax=Cyanobium gracile (strain ATCC 27147 / PCC 6307) TaxID=292564 RepID=K9P9J7_CYAGP|nr:glycosyltransferase [Cyanobium gracile]AFY29371.1 glycosyl transferase [Cyanobium gracile PCC 6307]